MTTVFAVFLVFSISAIVPGINGQNTIKIIENKTEATLTYTQENFLSEMIQERDEISIKELILLCENTEYQNSKDSLILTQNILPILKNFASIEDIKIPCDFVNQYGKDLLKSKSIIQTLNFVRERIIPLYASFQSYVKEGMTKNEPSPELQDFMENFGKNKIKSNCQNENDYGFNNYWINYETCLALWLTDPTSTYYPDWDFMQVMNVMNIYSSDNYIDWWDEYVQKNDFVMLLITFLIAVGVVILLLTVPLPEFGLNILGAGMVAAGAYLAGGYAAYVYYSNSEFIWLLDKEVDMHIRFINNNTKEGITNLHIDPNYIRAKNDNAIEECDESPGQDPDPIYGDFVYYIKLDEAFHDNETGWYSLSARGNNFEELYAKAPCPPGNWTISVFADGYEPIEDLNVSISTRGTKIIGPIVLFPEK